MSNPSAMQASLLTVAAEGAALIAALGLIAGVLRVPLLAGATPGETIRTLAALTLSYLVARVAGLLVQGALRRRESRALAADSTLIGGHIAEKLSRRSE